ncbi:uncharacterized protein LOC126560962 [Anopheles maculipalpis]|uniref:uncharacterized protein LOC126560962 n=1 Tax=Anopheles maculipalpis TaxID=1496333 RepID=UPI002159A76A|nr:uncharacterized protein LOC126560962 [Anopheles maculipalpis]
MDLRANEEMGHNNELTMTEERKITSTPVMEFYRDKCVLITGGTGFIGRLLIEKLLRINVRQIILLSRPKKGKTAQQRCDDLFSSIVFMNLKKDCPNFIDRVKLVDADLQHPSLGLSDESIEYIVNNAQIVLHAASDVRFDQALKKAIEVNVRGTRDLLRIAEKIVNLELFVYISTAYSNCPQGLIKEQFYTPPSEPEKMIQLVEAMDERFEEHMNKTVNDFIHPWPNTYVYTKALTEDVVRQYGELLPIAVVRPSIVIATNEEPIGGWTDNIYGLNGVIAGIALGIIRIMHVDDNNKADIIPADIVVNAVLAAGWQTYVERFIYHHLRKSDRPLPEAKTNGELKGVAKPRTKIYNCVTGNDNPISYQKIYEYSIEVGKHCPPKKSLWIVCHNTTTNKYMYEFYKLIYHLLPALLIDTYLRVIRRTPRVMDLYRKVHKFATVIEYFANGRWTFENDNMKSLREKLSPDDQIMFPCNIQKIEWADYFWTYIHGLRKHIANEPLENLDEAIKRHKQMRIVHYFILAAYYSVWALMFYYLFKAVGMLVSISKMSLQEFKENHSAVKDFYEGKTVLLTGGSGFLGKLFIEKWIKCGVREILLLLRAKKGITPEERLKALLKKEAVFVNYQQQPELYLSKLKVIEGDISKPGLAISNDDLDYVIKNTNIILHSAADVRFDASMKESVETNVRGTDHLLKIAENCENLEVFVHVSSAFSQCIHETVEEKFYKPNIDPLELIKLIENEPHLDEFEAVSKKIVEPWPNTYAFTKALAEEVVRQRRTKLPIAIVRPSIVTSTYADPIPGWTDNFYGFNGVVSGAGTGVLRIFHIHDEYKANIIPADIVINGTLVAAYYAAKHPQEENVFNCTMDENYTTWGDIRNDCLSQKGVVAVKKSLWIPTYNTTRYYYVASFLQIFYHLIPAVFFDLIMRFRGEKPQILRLYRKVHRFSDVLRFFTNHQFKFATKRMRHVLDGMEIVDRYLFPCDMKSVVWSKFGVNHIRGCRVYLLGEPWDTNEEALRIHKRRQLIHWCMLGLIYSCYVVVALRLLEAAGVPDLRSFVGCTEFSRIF